MTALLQILLDGPDRGAVLETARQVGGLVDALELGPSLLRVEGPALVTAVREIMPDRPVACWAGAEAEVEQLLAVGVEGLTVPASVSDDALQAIITQVREAGRRILLDLSGVSDITTQGERWGRLNPDLLKVPVEGNFQEIVGRLRELEIPLAFSGGWNVAQVPWLLLYRPVALIAGSVITATPEPRRIVEAIRARMEITPMMGRFY
ncbi:MAG: hypothetical protein ACE5I9_01105 [Candidatus Methylomirabilales bacterium]